MLFRSTRLAAARLSCFKDRIVVEAGNELSSYGPDGELFRRLSVKNAGGAPVMASSGTVFAGGNDWILYAYRFERPLEALPLPVPALLDRQSILDAGRKALLWYPGGSSDDVVIAMLADIEKSLKSGTIGGSASEAALAAAAVALGELEAPFGFGPLQQGPMPKGALARVQACELLGSLGFPAAVDVLAQVFRVDREPAVRAAAASAVAAIGLDPGGKALDAFADAAATRLDTRVARSVIGAIEALYRASGGLDKPSGALALLRIMGEAAYPGDLRRRAEETLRRLTSP